MCLLSAGVRHALLTLCSPWGRLVGVLTPAAPGVPPPPRPPASPTRAAHMVWAFSARAAHIGSYYAIKYVDPIWNGTTR